MASLETAMARVAGRDAPGLLGTALAQAVATAIGLAVAGVPAVLPLAVATVQFSARRGSQCVCFSSAYLQASAILTSGTPAT